MENKKSRNSSLELLRIISMLIIVGYHYTVHGGYEAFSNYSLKFGLIFIQILGLFGKVACSIFALISGYFLIDVGVKHKHYRRIVPLVAETHFYYFLIWVIVLLTDIMPVSIIDTIKSFFPLFWGTWYIVYYFILFLLIPFLNPWLKSMDKMEYIKFLILLMVIWSIVPTFTVDAWEFGYFDFFLIMYIIGAFLKLHEQKDYDNRWNLVAAITFILLMILSVCLFDAVGIVFKNNLFIDKATYFRKYNSVLAVGCAIFVFLYFSHLKFHSRVINRIASTTLGIYLIHNNFYLSDWIWTVFYPNTNYVEFPFVHAFLKILGVFFVCMIVEFVRQITVGQFFDKWFNQHCDQFILHIKRTLGPIIKIKEDIHKQEND